MATASPHRPRRTARTTATRATATPRPRGAARRTALLDATLALVGELGADAITHRAVAARADLPLASTTYWFQSKDELLTEALRHAADRDAERLRAAVAPLADTTPTVGTIVDVLLADPEGGDRSTLMATYALMLEAARRPALQAISEEWTNLYLTTLGDLLRRAGSRRPADDARLLIAVCDGVTLDRLATGADPHPERRPELVRLLEALLR